MNELITKLVEGLKTLTLTNVLVFALLVVTSIPAYLLYRIVNDERLLTYVFSSFEIVQTEIEGECDMVRIVVPPDGDRYFIRDTFLTKGSAVHGVYIRTESKPTPQQMIVLCNLAQRYAEVLANDRVVRDQLFQHHPMRSAE